MQVAIDFAFPFHWLINRREIFKPITFERSNCNREITFYSRLKTALNIKIGNASNYPNCVCKVGIEWKEDT